MSTSNNAETNFHYGLFPKDFTWGVANSAYQAEGAWNKDGKGESIWDRFCHEKPSRIYDGSNGDEAMDSYNKYKEDVQLLKNMGVHMYRFSISWSRILPKGTMEKINQPGIDYYNNLINELLVNGIQPCVTLFHWDLPQNLQDMDGWLSQEIIGLFGEYARICFEKFGDRVKNWITINEPYIFSIHGYDLAMFAPGIKEPLESPYAVVHTMLKAHAVAYRIYKKEFYDKQQGKVGIAIDTSYYGPSDPNSKEDCEAADTAFQFRFGWVANPLVFGEYPGIMKQKIDKKSHLEGRKKSRLPEFDSDWSAMVKGSFDFIGLNYYTAELVKPISGVSSSLESNSPGWNADQDTDRYRDPSWKTCGAVWQRDVPWGLRKTLCWIKNQYGNPTVIITENGMSEATDRLDDDNRVEYFKGHINETLKAIELDGCNVKGYLGWCLLDVFEWTAGYNSGFGIHRVDRKSPDKTRTPKKSALFLTNVFRDNGFP